MMVVYRVEILRDGQWTYWGAYLYERMAERVKQRREQEGLPARVLAVTVD